jgi:hypothetical protein
MIVRDRRDVDRDIVLGDYLLRRDLHRNRAEGHAHHLLDRKEDERKTRSAHALEFSEKKHNAALILAQHAKRAEKIHDRKAENPENDSPIHGASNWLSRRSRRLGTKPRRNRRREPSGAPAPALRHWAQVMQHTRRAYTSAPDPAKSPIASRVARHSGHNKTKGMMAIPI